MIMLKLKTLESDLQQLDGFISPNVKLEQYQTPPRLAAQILISIHNDIEGKVVLDLGCGTGILGLGCARLGASRVIGVDIDTTAIQVARQNATEVGLSSDEISFIIKDVRCLTASDIPPIDTVVMNPPFGTKSEVNMDYEFVQKGLQFSKTVYSLHKSSTRDFWRTKVDWKVELLHSDIPFPITKVFKFHKREMEYVNVDLFRHVRVS